MKKAFWARTGLAADTQFVCGGKSVCDSQLIKT